MELPHNPAANASFGWLQALAAGLARKPAVRSLQPLLLPAPTPSQTQCCA
jgi:hypothetical protein